jgi:alkylmercury lyase
MVKTNQKKTNSKRQQAFDKVMANVFESVIPELEQRRIVAHTLQLLANGCPVPPDEMAIHLQVSPDKVISTLEGFGAEFDKEGNVLGLGLTLVPTLHAYEANGRKLYTWCAADALEFPVMLKHTAHIESPDPVTGEKVRISVTSDRVERVEPEGAVVSWVNNVDVTDIRGSICKYVHFFSSPEAASEWIAEHPGKTFYSVNDVYQAMKHTVQNNFSDMETKTCC